MSKTNFWKNWDTDLKYPYLFLMVLAAAALLLGAYYYLAGNTAAYAWDKISDLQVVPVPVHEVVRLLEPFTLYADGYLLLEQYDTAPAIVHTWPAAVFLGILSLCLVFYTAAISTMRQIPYFVGISLLMLFLASFNIDLLQVFSAEQSQAMLLIAIVLLAGLSYGFQAFWKHIAFGWRVLAMLVTIIVLGVAIFTEAEFAPDLTALHLVNYSSLATLIATLLFIIWISYENVNALLWINTQGKTPERRYSLWQFVLIAGLYLSNLMLLYLRHMGYLQTDLIYVNGYLILLLSVVAGFWGMQQREAFYGRYFPFKPTGAVLYLVFATIAFLSIGYAYATANDSLTTLFHTFIIYTHLVYGSVFFLYLMMNFGKLIKERKPVYKVVYEPRMFTLFSFFLMSTVILAILVIRTQYSTYFQAKAGYYNYLGDLYTASENPALAKRFYEESDVYDINNVKANYSLASMYRAESQRNNEIVHLKGALGKRPNPKLYVRMANLYDEKEYFFEKLYVLHEGINRFPESSEIYNNMALLYMQTSVTDSVEYYFNLAEKYSSDKEVIQSNKLAFYTRQAMLEPARALLNEAKGANYKSLRSNMAALRQLLGVSDRPDEAFAPDSLEQVEDFTLFYNQTISRLNNGDTSQLKAIDRYLKMPGNQLFQEDLLYSKALVHHYNGRPKEARSIVENLALTASGRSGYYYNALGIWMLEEENYLAGAHYFKQAKDLGYTQAFLSHGYALAMAHKPEAAVNALQEVGYTGLESATEVAGELEQVLQQNVRQTIASGSDDDKVKYLQTYLPQLTIEQVDALVKSVKEKELHRVALLSQIDYLMHQHKWRLANKAIKMASPQLQPEGELRSKLNLQQLKLWHYTKNYDALLDRMDNVFLTRLDKRYKLYFKASIAAAKGRDREAAEKYSQAVKILLFDEEVVKAASAFYKQYAPDEMTAYDILLDGITYNPFSAELHKAYALESLDRGLISYAEGALTTLQSLLTASEYTTFIKQFESHRQAAAKKADNWQL
jgi:cellulose synthase operon protein C